MSQLKQLLSFALTEQYDRTTINRKLIAALTMATDGQPFESLLAEARSLRQRGLNKKAIEVYKRALEANAESIQALNELGLVQIHVGDQIEAIEAFDRAIAIDPKDPTGHSNKAEAYLTTGSFDDALRTAQTGLKEAKDSAILLVKKARALESLLKIDEAIEAYYEALKFESEDPEIWKALALCLDAKERWPEVSRAYRIAGGLHEKRGEGDEAEYCLKFAEMAENS
ncbi:MAG: tetratricopeptide repeat protein [Candidatus Thorarchaeota archaeon]|nr:MAG: tetratricopeptide repeat protein [Candidatus Thorarchaeota archaeon]